MTSTIAKKAGTHNKQETVYEELKDDFPSFLKVGSMSLMPQVLSTIKMLIKGMGNTHPKMYCEFYIKPLGAY